MENYRSSPAGDLATRRSSISRRVAFDGDPRASRVTSRDRTPLLYATVDGDRTPVDLTRAVLAFSVDEDEKKATKISLTLDDPEQRFRAMLPQGAQIAVRWGWPGALSRPRGGIIHKVEYRNEDFTLSIDAFGKELALSHGPIRRSFREQTFRQSVEALAREASVRVRWEAEDTITFDGTVIDDEHAWAWIQRQSAALGLVVTMDGDEILVREPITGDAPTRVLLWGWRGGTVLSFEVEENTKKSERESEGVVAVFVDPATGTTLQHAAGSPTTSRQTLARRRLDASTRPHSASERTALAAFVAEHPDLASRPESDQVAAWRASTARRQTANRPPTTDEPAMLTVNTETGEAMPATTARVAAASSPIAGASPAAANGRQTTTPVAANAAGARAHTRRVAEGTFRAHERAKVKAKLVCEGEPQMRRCDVLRVLGAAERDAGLWYAKSVRHTIEDGGYVTEAELQRDGVNSGRGRRHAGAARPAANATSGATSSGTQSARSDHTTVDLARESG